jgi:AraC-like DNA-binding protein
VLLRHAGDRVAVPRLAFLRESGVPFWRREFIHLCDGLAAPTPAGLLDVALRTAFAIRRLLAIPDADTSPAARMKRLLEDDANAHRNLADLSRECGLSPDHLRLRFRAAYGLTPAEYRARRRLSVANDLIASSELSLKEVAAAAGYRHASHLSAAYKRAFGLTPREALRRLRQG